LTRHADGDGGCGLAASAGVSHARRTYFGYGERDRFTPPETRAAIEQAFALAADVT